MPRPPPARGKGKRQRFYARNAVKTTLYRDAQAFDAIKNSSGADQLCQPVMRHAGAPLPIWAFWPRLSSSAPVCGTNCSKKQRSTGPSGIPGARTSAAGRQRQKSGCGARNVAWPPDTSEKSGLPGTLRPVAPAKMLVFMQLFRLPPHYVMRCGPIDLVTMSPRRLR
jgi:hypothetical protein